MISLTRNAVTVSVFDCDNEDFRDCVQRGRQLGGGGRNRWPLFAEFLINVFVSRLARKTINTLQVLCMWSRERLARQGFNPELILDVGAYREDSSPQRYLSGQVQAITLHFLSST